MPFRRKPPAHNVRRVRALGTNGRGTRVNKARELVQYESWQEQSLWMLFDRDPSIKVYRTQPESLSYRDDRGRERTYTPDALVVRVDGRVELHEVTIEGRRTREDQARREAAARAVCAERGWAYIVHTERDLPRGTELANLQALARFRARCHEQVAVTAGARELLRGEASLPLRELHARVVERLGIAAPDALAALCHLLWHGRLRADLASRLLLDERGGLAPSVAVAWATGEGKREGERRPEAGR